MIEEAEAAAETASTARVFQDLSGNPFEMVTGEAGAFALALDAKANNGSSAKVLEMWHRESTRNLGRLMRNVSAIAMDPLVTPEFIEALLSRDGRKDRE